MLIAFGIFYALVASGVAQRLRQEEFRWPLALAAAATWPVGLGYTIVKNV